MSIGGWTGKILRVNLTTGNISYEDTTKYQDFIGGMGFGYKVMFDEVPKGTKPYDPENKIIFGTGPLCGSGIPCSSRTNITSLYPGNDQNLVTDSHMGGSFAVGMKYAGWDSIIVEGASKKPVWLRIEDDNVSIEDASSMWGHGIFDATAMVASIMGKEAHVAAIGQAGENLVNMSTIQNGHSHSAGGHGGVMGSKKLKAIGIIGTGSVKIAGDIKQILELDKYMLTEIIGANNNHVVPSTPQPWAEFDDPASRWTAQEGLHWGASEGNIETGICEPGNVNKVGYRTMKAIKDLGPVGPKYTTRMGGCPSCPIRCDIQVHVPQLEKYGVSPYASNTCAGWPSVMIKGSKDFVDKEDGEVFVSALGAQLADDYGVWCNYSQMGRDFKYAYDNGILKKVLPEDEYNSIPWDLLEAGDPEFMIDFYRRIAFKEGEFSHLGDGAYYVSKRWNFGDDYWNGKDGKGTNIWNHLGYPKHHANESAGQQVGTLINCLFNRDAQCHTHSNFLRSGLPTDVLKAVAADIWGSADAVDPPSNYTPMNEYKAKFAKWSIVRNCLHDSLTLCNWMWPMMLSPLKERNYKGDTSLESKYFSIITGVETTEEELDLMGERILTLHRALTVKEMGTVDMRNEHDKMNDWIFDADPDINVFSPGTIKMDRDDMQLALTMFYKEMGWDEKSGAPTKSTLERLGMHDVASELGKLGLLPA